ncbi:MAG: cytochrome C [Deltaproteobacteria bacterium]|nr:cytochrome C [Deltaproteobacteria bacterium]
MKWNTFLLILFCAIMVSGPGTALSQPQPPVVTPFVSGTWAQFSWTGVSGATGYTLSYAPKTSTGFGSIVTVDVGMQTRLSVYLWPGAAYYMAVQSRDASGVSPYSNIVEVVIEDPGPLSGEFQVFAFNDLGMHCYDPDFSVFSILPLYNVLNAQVIQKGTAPKIMGPAVSVTYQAMADQTGSINMTSAGKTNFWDYVLPLFGADLQVDEGLMGAKMPGITNQPQPLPWEGENVYWFSAAGIPITSLDDNLNVNSYPLMNVKAMDPLNTAVLSSLPVVVPISDEMNCNVCHATGNVGASISGLPWSANANPAIQYRENVLILHDYRNGTNLFNSQPVLCASCHYSPALDLTHAGPVGPQITNPTLSRAVHGYHATRTPVDPPSGNACYYCHPGENTQCARGAMDTAGLSCSDCHGTLTAVGHANRTPWTDLPTCQSCHTGDALNNYDGQIIRRRTYADSPDQATFIVAANKRFAEQAGTLYRNSVGHNGVSCPSCHGSPHAIWPSREANDNLAALQIQGHDGMITECAACHGSGLPLTLNGPHGIHNVNSQAWVKDHEEFKSQAACGTCHGATGDGTVISKAAADRIFEVEDRIVAIPKGTQIGCGLCHENELVGDDDDDD